MKEFSQVEFAIYCSGHTGRSNCPIFPEPIKQDIYMHVTKNNIKFYCDKCYKDNNIEILIRLNNLENQSDHK